MAKTEERVIFFVEQYHDESGWYSEPIAIMRGDSYVSAANDSDTSFASYRAFSAKYFRSGQKYPVYYDDLPLGEMTVVEPDTEFACLQLTARVQVKYAAKHSLTTEEPGIAFSNARSLKPLHTAPSRTEDSTLAMKLAQKEFASRKIAKTALRNVQLNRIRAVDLDSDGDLESIATFETSQTVYSKVLKMNTTVIHFITLIIDDGKVTYSYYVHGAEEGDENGNFASRQDIAGISDLDLDGVAEIIFRNFYYESWDFTIVQRKGGQWKHVWQGGGGGC